MPQRLPVLFATLVFAVLASACSRHAPDELDERDTRTVCVNLGASGWDTAVQLAAEAGAEDPGGAVRRAVHETCPAYADKVEG